MVGRRRILVVDADDYFLIEMERLLENQGFDTTTTWASDQATELLLSGNFDLALIGDHPPEIDARTVLQRLRAMRRPVPCLVLHPLRATGAEGIRRVGSDMARATPVEILKVVEEQIGASLPRLAA